MLDINFVRENPSAIEKDLKKRNEPEKLKWFDDLLKKENVNFMEVGGTQLHWLHTPIGHRIHVVAQCIQVLVGADANLGVPVSTHVVQDLI